MPGLAAIYRAVYRLQRARLRRALREAAPGTTVLLRGSARRRPRPGTSDIDTVVLMDEPSANDAHDRVVTLIRCVRRINRLAPLARDLTLFSPAEVRLLAALGSHFLALVEIDSEVLVEGRADLASWIAGARAPTEDESAAALRHAVAYWTHKALRQWIREPESVGAPLARRSLAKASYFAERTGASARAAVVGWGEGPTSRQGEIAQLLRDGLHTLDAVLGHAARAEWPAAEGTARFDAGTDALRAQRGVLVATAADGAQVVALDPTVADASALLRLRATIRERHPSARLTSVRQLARRPLLPGLALAPLAGDELPPVEVAPGEASWAARLAIWERWTWLRERIEQPWSPAERARHLSAVAELLPRAWRMAELPGAPPALSTSAVGDLRRPLFRVLHAGIAELGRVSERG